MQDKYFVKIKTGYSFLLVVLIIGFLWLITLRTGQYSSLSKGFEGAVNNILLTNPMVSIPIYVIVFTPIIYSGLYLVLRSIFPLADSGGPYKSKIYRLVTQLVGVLAGLFVLTVLLIVNRQIFAAKVMFMLISVVWFLLISILLFSSNASVKQKE